MNQFNNNFLAINFELDDLQLVGNNDDLFLAPEESSLFKQVTSRPFSLAEEKNPSPIINPSTPIWKVMIVDDDHGVHQVTQLALHGFTF